MTVEELIEKLKAFDMATTVVTNGFDESGYDDIGEPKLVNIVKVSDQVSHSGMYKDADDIEEGWDRPIGRPFKAVHINF